MRASEFIFENNKKGTLRKDDGDAMTGAIIFRDEGYDRIYNLNRIMIATAMSDGKSTGPLDMDASSWTDRYNTAHPYTEEEHNMMKQAFATINTDYTEYVKDHRSKERADTHKVSPVSSFRGY